MEKKMSLKERKLREQLGDREFLVKKISTLQANNKFLMTITPISAAIMWLNYYLWSITKDADVWATAFLVLAIGWSVFTVIVFALMMPIRSSMCKRYKAELEEYMASQKEIREKAAASRAARSK